MIGFERLHPVLQHHVVNSLGWRNLRPLQEQAIAPILAGENCLLLAPTAGGKTEAAVLPVLSAMLSGHWQGLSVLYICPLRALLNNLEQRLSHYASLVGRRCGTWHGDVPQALRSRILSELPDVLLTTPESLEALLISTRTDKPHLFRNLQAVIIDEVHAFAGDDRGWHLLGVLERIGVISATHPQRIGLSATVGNPAQLLAWMCGGMPGPARVVAPGTLVAQDADVLVDFVGDIGNAALVISRLHQGEKRLVFCDSRSRCEALASRLRQQSVATFVSHSSLSADQRRDAESAFRDSRDCVIVATSTLELGIDVGDLDRVIQLDSPTTVASFLQRLGRSGRRAGSHRNCLFLTTSHESLLQAAGIVELWRMGQVEPLVAPPLPMHVVAQQLMGLILQQRGLGAREWRRWIGNLVCLAGADASAVDRMVSFMLERQILVEDSGILAMGPAGEHLYGGKNYMELLSVFQSVPLIRILHGNTELGHVHPLSLYQRHNRAAVLSLAGRSWQVVSYNRAKGEANVTAADGSGKSHWLGSRQPLSYTLCQMIRKLLMDRAEMPLLSRRARVALEEMRSECRWVAPDASVVMPDPQTRTAAWWTFAGQLANNQMALELGALAGQADNFKIRLVDYPTAINHLQNLQAGGHAESTADPGQLDLKFEECLPQEIAHRMNDLRHRDATAVDEVRRIPVITASPDSQ